MTHDSRLTQALRVLLHSRRVASLGTVGDDGTAFVSMVPFALEPIQGAKKLESGSEAWQASHDAYLARFPEAEPMTQLGDFVFFAITAAQARHVAGFGAARSIDEHEVRRAMIS